MSIVTFWNNGREQTGKTLSIAAIATHIAIEHNKKILIISTGYRTEILNRCFWQERKPKKKSGLFGPNTNIALEDGVVGLEKVMRSNKLSAEMITNYTKIIFKDRLEILPSFKGSQTEYERIRKIYPDVINLANNYYDLVLVDLDYELGQELMDTILGNSNLIVANVSQRLSSINAFIESKETTPMLKSSKVLILIGRYDRYSKYSIKNISRYMKEKNNVSTIPYNTLFFEASEEAGVPDLFLKLRRVSEDDRNSFFLEETKRAGENILYRLDHTNVK